MSLFRYLVLMITISVSSSVINPTYSTHMIGGEIFYECLNSSINFYRFTVKLYRDCYTGVPPYDDPIYVSVYDSLENLLIQFEMALPPDDTLENNTYNVCLYAPVDICVQEAVYQAYYILPPGRYHMTYQRCCRNQGIVNMYNPTGQGAGWDIAIPDPAKAACNSSPYFNNYPPTIICLDDTFRYDHSATDPDGDSLVYYLCTPNDYNNQTWGIIPNPPGPPSSNVDVNYVTPYDSAYPIFAPSDPFQIDPQTGWLTGTPEQIGKYVVGICVSEYRNGVLLSTNKRDFQYNVAGCLDDVTAHFTINTVCGNTIEFNNTSWHGTDYYWDFGVPNTASDTSTQANPIYTYSDSGSYDVTLIVNKGLFCADSITVPISAAPVDFSLAFTVNKQVFFSPPFGVQFTNTTPNLSSYNYTWSFGDGATEQNNDTILFHEYLYNGYYDITLIAQDTFTGCTDTLLMEDYIFCTGGTIGIDYLRRKEIQIHPNPTTGILIIEGIEGIVTVYDIYGRLVLTTNSNVLDISQAAMGIYFVHVLDEQGKVYSQKVVKY